MREKTHTVTWSKWEDGILKTHKTVEKFTTKT